MNEGERLCRACGLCCDGSLFGRGPLEPSEVDAARRHLAVVNDRAFEQPCVALAGDRSCTIYEVRPKACRRFICKLHERHDEPIELRLAAIARVRALLADLDALGPAERDELADRIERDFTGAALRAMLRP